MKNKKTLFSKIKSKDANIMAIALSTVGFLVITTMGVSNLILASSGAAKNTERNNNAYLAAESGIENALYEVSFHSNGYEVAANNEEDDYTFINLTKHSASEAWWSTEAETDFAESVGSTSISIPAQSDEWSESGFGSKKVFKLYGDNTSCVDANGNPC